MAHLSEHDQHLRAALAERYAIERQLGQGAFATVFLARDLRHDRPVAIKLLHAHYAESDAERRFHREIGLLGRLQHPNILPLHDSGRVLDQVFYVVPYVEGRSLRDRLDQERQLAIDDVVCIAREIADALAYAHRKGVIHRDIKPENILLSSTHAIVADFGVAFALDDGADRRLTRSGGGSPGTPLYMSPEQLAGRDVDARSDIYSLGLVVYEMVTGAPPFTGPGAMARRFTEVAPSCASVRAGVPEALERVIASALAFAPDDRFVTAEAMARALDDATRPDAQIVPVRPAPAFQLPPRAGVARLIGREADLANVTTLLSRSRLVTLVGPGGVGKSSLALQSAVGVQSRFRDGCLVVSLEDVPSPELVVPAIAERMQLTFAGPREPRLQLLDALCQRDMLLLLDGFDHLMGAATLVAELLDAAPHVRVLATSRERLNLREESAVELRGLATTEGLDHDGIAGSARALFVERARRGEPHFAPSAAEERAIDEICELVGGLPLGIEIAASLVRVLTCQDIAAELAQNPGALVTHLRDVPSRHRSLGAVFERSWDLLEESQQLVLMRLSLFHGPFARDAAIRVAGATLSDLTSLLDKSFLQRAPDGRFALHRVVRQFADAKLRAAPDVASTAAGARCDYYSEWLERREADATGARLYEVIDEMADHLEGIRHGWRHALRRGHDRTVTTYLAGLWRFYLVRGRYREGLAELALADTYQLSPSVTSLQLARRAALALHAADVTEALRLARASVSALQPAHGDSAHMGIALAQLGYVASTTGKHRVATRLYRRALALLRRHGASSTEIGFTLLRQGIAQATLGQCDAAERTYHEALGIFDITGEPRARVMTMTNLAIVLSDVGRTTEALEVRRQVLDIADTTPDWFIRAAAQLNLGGSLSDVGRFEEARSLIRRALDGFRTGGRSDGIVMCQLMWGQLERAAGTDLEASEEHLLTAIGEAGRIGVTSFAMEGVCELALLRAAQGHVATAATLAELASRHVATPEHSRRKARALRERLIAEAPALAQPAAVPELRSPGDYGKLLEMK